MIEYNDVSIKFDDKVILSGFSFAVAKGEKAVMHGPSGSGKSTLMSMIPGFTIPYSGTLAVGDVEVKPATIDTIRKTIAWVPQEAAIPFEFVKELIDAPFGFKCNRNKIPGRDAVVGIFQKLGLDGSIYDKRLSEISGGEQQRVMITIAALLRKDIMLLDEPTSALDHESIQKLISFIKSLEGTTVLAISHDRHFMESFDKRIKVGAK